MSARERIQREAEQWFLTEPVFFTVYCSHRLTMNANMQCPIRAGQGRIEYNPTLIESLQDNQLREVLKVEMIRILLQHPYTRQPLGCKPTAMHMASDMVIAPSYRFTWLEMVKPSDFCLKEGQHYEWYASRLNEILANPNPGGGMPSSENGFSSDSGQGESKSGDSSANDGGEENDEEDGNGTGTDQPTGTGCKSKAGLSQKNDEGDAQGADEAGGVARDADCTTLEEEEASRSGPGQKNDEGDVQQAEEPGDVASDADYTALWEEDAFQARQITDMVKSTTQWGSLPGGLIELIKESATGRIDYRNALMGFRSTILSQKRRLTRMRPSRRFGFEQMGSRYDFTTRLLVALDTSGSVGSEELGRYLRIINKFFKYGIEEIDVLMFDAKIQSDPVTLKNARKPKELQVKGRGGTDFQAPVNYMVDHPGYDGLIIITDGYAPVPKVPARLVSKLLWVIDNEESYKTQYEMLRKTGRVCLMQV